MPPTSPFSQEPDSVDSPRLVLRDFSFILVTDKSYSDDLFSLTSTKRSTFSLSGWSFANCKRGLRREGGGRSSGVLDECNKVNLVDGETVSLDMIESKSW